MDEQEWEHILNIRTAGRDDSHSDGEHHPYEPTDYGVLERLANSGYIGKKDTLVDYGSGKGRVSFFLAYQTRCQAIGVEYDRRLWEKALANGQTAASRRRVTFVLADAVEYEILPLFAGDDDREKSWSCDCVTDYRQLIFGFFQRK